MKKITLLTLLVALLASCGGQANKSSDNKIAVSIVPLKYFVDKISGGDFEVTVLVPPGASPETFEPTINQMKQLSDSKSFITLGLMDFEKSYLPNIKENMPNTTICNLSEYTSVTHDHCSCCAHGVDPHIWLSIKNAKIIANQVYNQLISIKKDSLQKYNDNLNLFLSQIDSLDNEIKTTVKKGTFLIYHPSLGYLSQEYGLTQVAIEDEGKEPSVLYIKELINKLKDKKINIVLYQEQLNKSAVESLSEELKVEMKPFDPLAYDWLENMKEIISLIKQSTDGQ